MKQKAAAIIEGRGGVLHGRVTFREEVAGVTVTAEIYGLPLQNPACGGGVFGIHIHDQSGHYNPTDCPHPYHAGDLPPLFSVNGYARASCLTGRFSIVEIIGKQVVIHERPDDFTTQPSGNSGAVIGEGVIREC